MQPLQTVAAGVNTTNNATIGVAVTGVPKVGNVLTLVGRMNANQTVSSISDTVNNWTVIFTNQTNTGGGAVQLYFAWCICAGNMSGQTITVTFTGSNTSKSLWCIEWDGLGAPGTGGLVRSGFFEGTARNAGTITPGTLGAIVMGFAAYETVAATAITPAAGFTRMPTATAAGYLTGSNISVEGIYQVVTAAGAKNVTWTGVSVSAYAGAVLWFRPRTGPNPGNFQSPAVFARAVKDRWRRRRSGIFVPDVLPGPALELA